jgi:hypothetical protein
MVTVPVTVAARDGDEKGMEMHSIKRDTKKIL